MNKMQEGDRAQTRNSTHTQHALQGVSGGHLAMSATSSFHKACTISLFSDVDVTERKLLDCILIVRVPVAAISGFGNLRWSVNNKRVPSSRRRRGGR